MELTTIVFHMESQPDFEKLKKKGWKHPLGLQDKPMEDGLVKGFGEYEIIMFHHAHSPTFNYTEAFIDHKHEKPVMLKGEGKGMDRITALQLVNKLYEEIEGKG